jgi:predicted metal-dependent phosphoesterase TrpH
MIDLHTHSTYSDGTLSPADLLRHARDTGLEAVALTDHDTVRGVLTLGVPAPPPEFVPGIEISIQYHADRRFHMLGLFINPARPESAAFEQLMDEKRHERNRAIVEKLAALGCPMDYEEVRSRARGIVGRMHIALTMLDKGYIQTLPEAFTRYLNTGRPAYVARYRLPSAEGIAFIHSLGGVAVLAHIGKEIPDRDEMRGILADLKGKGLDGMETRHPDHAPELREWLDSLAGELGLAISGGSDFHGDNKPAVSLGRGRGNLEVEFEIYLRLKELADEWRATSKIG